MRPRDGPRSLWWFDYPFWVTKFLITLHIFFLFIFIPHYGGVSFPYIATWNASQPPLGQSPFHIQMLVPSRPCWRWWNVLLAMKALFRDHSAINAANWVSVMHSMRRWWVLYLEAPPPPLPLVVRLYFLPRSSIQCSWWFVYSFPKNVRPLDSSGELVSSISQSGLSLLYCETEPLPRTGSIWWHSFSKPLPPT